MKRTINTNSLVPIFGATARRVDLVVMLNIVKPIRYFGPVTTEVYHLKLITFPTREPKMMHILICMN